MRTDFAPGHHPTAAEALACFATVEMERRAYSDHTRRSYRVAVQGYLDLVAPTASTPADHLDLASVERFAGDLERRQTRTTTRHIKLAAVKTFISYLEKHEVLPVPFSHAIVVPTVKQTRPPRPNSEGVAVIARLAEHSPRDAALIALLLHAGIRLSELIALTLDDLTLPEPARRVAVRSATRSVRRGARRGAQGHASGAAACPFVTPSVSSGASLARLRVGDRRSGSREILLDAATGERLAVYLSVRPSTNHRRLFVTKGGAPLTFTAASSLVRMYARAAGISGLSARSLRAACITGQLHAGRAVADVQRLVGHKGISTTRRYTDDLPHSSVHTHSVAAAFGARADAHQEVVRADMRSGGVLLVSGEVALRMALRCALQTAGHTVYEAPDAATALDMLRLARIPLVVVVRLSGAHSVEPKELHLLLANDVTLTPRTSIVIAPEATRLPASLASLLVGREVTMSGASLDLDALVALVARTLATLISETGECRRAWDHATSRDHRMA